MTCSVCDAPITKGQKYLRSKTGNYAHVKCPSDSQASLMAEDNTLPIDHVPETYPD